VAARQFLALADAGAPALRAMLEAAHAMKAGRAGRPRGSPDAARPLDGHVLAAIFEKPSTRTRLSFDIAMRQLGGATITLAAGDLQLGRGETIPDTARVVSRMVDAVMIRARSHDDVEAFAAAATVPVVNGLTDRSHPCQIMADLMTVEERLGRPVQATRWAWLGDGNNVAWSLIEAAGLLGFALHLATPAGFAPDPAIVAEARARGAEILLSADPDAAVAGADVVVTDTWVSMGDSDVAARHAALAPFQVDRARMARAAAHALFLHCLPAHRSEEVTDAVMDGPQSAVWDEAENRIHAQKAILLWLFGHIG
jgi:ornithine carbamoyltransferase